jgi:cytoskeletal protein CcmA (bactofilin family)
MWNKSAEAKPSSQAPDTAVPVIPAPSKNEQETQPVSAARATPNLATAYSAPLNASDSNGTTTIAAGLKISGEISGTSDLYIDGETQGKIRLSNARVTVGPNGRVHADIEAREIIIEGSVQGNLKAGERLHLGASSKLQGSVLTPRFAIEDGARLRGKVEMLRTGGSQAASNAETASDLAKAKAMSASGKDE